MNSRSRALFLPVFLLGSVIASCSDAQAGTGSIGRREATKAAVVADAPLATYQKELLDLAFETASAFPTMPHVKNRSLAQASVVEACLRLDQPQRALGYAQRIDNWRRGAGYADYAFYCAQKGDAASAQRHIDLAREVYEKTEKDEIQDWQRDTIRVTIAKALRSLDRDREAGAFEADLVESESAKLEAEKTALADERAFDERIQAVDAVVATGNFDQIRNALGACARLFDRFYEDADRRSRAESKIKTSWDKLPITVRVDLVLELAESALEHADRSKTLELVGEIVAIMDASNWKPELCIPMKARLAGIRHRAGDEAGARIEADAALAIFEAERDRIFDYQRAETLSPLAEAYRSMGDTTAALGIYAKAVAEGALNVNARPRAEDLCATACSMALHSVEPDADLRARMRKIRGDLRDPW